CIHMDPIVVNDKKVEKYKAITKKIISEIGADYSFHDFRIVDSEAHTNLIFDLTVPYERNKTSAEILVELRNRFHEKDEKINLIVTVEHSYV
ncbi:MAG: cation-efflux pump, partial [Eubacterium sp.]|nr:cation-efflux pump [Eubacterium sp.]